MRTRIRWIIFVAAAALVVGGAWWRASRAELEVETATVARGPFEETLVEDGRTRVRWHVDVTAPVSGEWSPVALRVGDTVAAGALLGTLTAAPWSLPADTTAMTDGAHELGATVSDTRGESATATLTVNVDNVMDEYPPQTAEGFFSQANTDPQLYRVLGRSFAISGRYRF